MDIENATAPRGITLKDSRIVEAEDVLLDLVNFYYRSEWEDDDFKGMTKEELEAHATEQEAVKHILHELYQLANDYDNYFKHPRKIKRVENQIELYCEYIDEITENLAITLDALEGVSPTDAVEKYRGFLESNIIGAADKFMEARKDARELPPI